jgi:hypothetical protein
MNTEKIEKLKKGLTNSQIPENLKQKIREQIARLEAEMKTDEGMTATEVKKEVTKIEKKVDDSVEVVEKKIEEEKEKMEEKVEAKKTTTRKPRTTKTVAKKPTTRKPSRTSKPKATAMTLAKEIRKEGESWSDARARASKMMKDKTKSTSKDVESELDKLIKLVRGEKNKQKVSGISNTNLKRDAVRKAKPRGARRVTHAGETSNQYGTFSNKLGRKYYESRDRHSDRLAPRYPKNAPLLADGGYLTDPNFGNFQSNVMFNKGGAIKNQYDGKTPEDIWDSLSVEQRKHFLIDHSWGNEEQIEQVKYSRLEDEDKEFVDYYAIRTWKKLSGDVRQSFREHVKLGQYNKGGALTNERLHVNKDEDYEVRYARPRPSRTGYKGVRGFALGGTVVTDLAGHTQAGDGGLDAGMPLSGFSNTSYSGLVGETGAMSSGEMFMSGGGVGKISFEDWLKKNNIDVYKRTYYWVADDGGSDYMYSGRKADVMKSLREDWKSNKYELGGGLPSGAEQSYMVTEALGNPAQHFVNGGGVGSFSEYSNDALYDMIINLSRFENTESEIKMIKAELEKRKASQKMASDVDLFVNYDEQPEELSEIVDYYMNKFDEGDYDYEDSKNFLNEVEAIGYTFDYGLDNEPYNLRLIETDIPDYTQMENNYANGGFMDGVYAMGGSLKAHGIEVGDTFVKTISGNIQKVKDKNGKIVYVDLSTGERDSQPPLPFENGGGVGMDEDIDLSDDNRLRVRKPAMPNRKLTNQELAEKHNSSAYEFMTDDKKAFGGSLFGSVKMIPKDRKYPNLQDKDVVLKNGKLVKVFSQSENKLTVMEFGKIGSGERPMTVDISEVETIYKNGGALENQFGKTKMATGGGIRRKNGQTYDYGRVWTNDHNQFDKSADHEINYRR